MLMIEKKNNVIYEDMIEKLPSNVEMMEVSIKKKRGRPPKLNKVSKGAVGNYFITVENHILNYLKEENKFEKDLIFNKYLYQPMYDMIWTIYRRYFQGDAKYPFEEDDPNDIVNDTFSFLITKLDKFKPGMKSKKHPDKEVTAYSYYQTIIKNFLRLKTLNYQKERKRNLFYQDISHEINSNERYSYSLEDDIPIPNQLINEISKNINLLINNKQPYLKLSQNEIRVGEALIDMLTNWDTLFSYIGSQKFTKNSIYFFLEEVTFLPKKDIKKILKRYKTIYFNSKKFIL